MRNTYLTSHFPLFSILLFSISFGMHAEGIFTEKLMLLGIYEGMMEFFSASGIKLTLLFLLFLLFFMIFSALKLIADTTIELSLLFFSRDQEGKDLTNIRAGSSVFLAGSFLSVIFFGQYIFLLSIFVLSVAIYFVFFVYKVADSLSTPGLIGLIFFHILFWSTFCLTVFYAFIKLYNSFVASLPL